MECRQTTLATAHSATRPQPLHHLEWSSTCRQHKARSINALHGHGAPYGLEYREWKRDSHGEPPRRNHQWEKQLTTGRTECNAKSIHIYVHMYVCECLKCSRNKSNCELSYKCWVGSGWGYCFVFDGDGRRWRCWGSGSVQRFRIVLEVEQEPETKSLAVSSMDAVSILFPSPCNSLNFCQPVYLELRTIPDYFFVLLLMIPRDCAKCKLFVIAECETH